MTLIDAGLAGTLLVGLLLNAALGWWWADPLTALVLAALAVEEGLEGVRGEGTSSNAVKAKFAGEAASEYSVNGAS